MKNNFRVRQQTRTSSPTEFALPPRQMQGTTVAGSTSATEWTDKKHSMYLKSMEASFVNQLYHSKQTFGRFSLHSTISSAQANPWIRHFQTSSKHGRVSAPALEGSENFKSQVVDLGKRKRISSGSATGSGSGQLHLCEPRVFHQDMLCSGTEMSDQNFADEEVEGEKENNNRNVKRPKSLIIDATDDDQIVPVHKSSTTGGVTKNCVSAA